MRHFSHRAGSRFSSPSSTSELSLHPERLITQTETRYTQIEKELLAIVFACEKFAKNIFGRDVVNVETDQV